MPHSAGPCRTGPKLQTEACPAPAHRMLHPWVTDLNPVISPLSQSRYNPSGWRGVTELVRHVTEPSLCGVTSACGKPCTGYQTKDKQASRRHVTPTESTFVSTTGKPTPPPPLHLFTKRLVQVSQVSLTQTVTSLHCIRCSFGHDQYMC